VVRLLSDGALHRRLARHARQLVEERHDWQALADAQLQIYEELRAAS